MTALGDPGSWLNARFWPGSGRHPHLAPSTLLRVHWLANWPELYVSRGTGFSPLRCRCSCGVPRIATSVNRTAVRSLIPAIWGHPPRVRAGSRTKKSEGTRTWNCLPNIRTQSQSGRTRPFQNECLLTHRLSWNDRFGESLRHGPRNWPVSAAGPTFDRPGEGAAGAVIIAPPRKTEPIPQWRRIQQGKTTGSDAL